MANLLVVEATAPKISNRQQRPLMAQPTRSASDRFLAHRSRSSSQSIGRCPPELAFPALPLARRQPETTSRAAARIRSPWEATAKATHGAEKPCKRGSASRRMMIGGTGLRAASAEFGDLRDLRRQSRSLVGLLFCRSNCLTASASHRTTQSHVPSDPNRGPRILQFTQFLHNRQHPPDVQSDEKGNLRFCAASTKTKIPTANATPPNCDLRSSVCNGHSTSAPGAAAQNAADGVHCDKSTIGRGRQEPQHEPRGGPEFELVHSGWGRPRSQDFSCANDAVVDGRCAQVAVTAGAARQPRQIDTKRPFD